MRRLDPCRILEKYGNKFYKVELPENIEIASVFIVVDLVACKGPIQDVD